ncbi:putative transcription regulator containing HTH domain protein [Bacteroidales bacterium Barb7]|nr:putative transcription regulator containing HTH domain protein [Bacteroidales bacterium Barb7]
MNIQPIVTEKDYEVSLERLKVIFGAKPGSAQGDELELLITLIDQYEQEHYPIGPPDPIEAAKFRREQMGYKPARGRARGTGAKAKSLTVNL